jgi:hypothetical protein
MPTGEMVLDREQVARLKHAIHHRMLEHYGKIRYEQND